MFSQTARKTQFNQLRMNGKIFARVNIPSGTVFRFFAAAILCLRLTNKPCTEQACVLGLVITKFAMKNFRWRRLAKPDRPCGLILFEFSKIAVTDITSHHIWEVGTTFPWLDAVKIVTSKIHPLWVVGESTQHIISHLMRYALILEWRDKSSMSQVYHLWSFIDPGQICIQSLSQLDPTVWSALVKGNAVSSRWACLNRFGVTGNCSQRSPNGKQGTDFTPIMENRDFDSWWLYNIFLWMEYICQWYI